MSYLPGRPLCVLLFSLLACFTGPALYAADSTLVPLGATWRYLDNGTDQGTSWRQLGFSDSTWKSGAAELGYGDGDERTVISYGSGSRKYITYYFRRSFSINDKSLFSSLDLKLKRDDGAVVYINGTEVFRSNMPTGTITYTTRASASSGATVEHAFSSSTLVNGTNVVAVEVHQNSPYSTDVSFDLQLVASGTASSSGTSSISITRGPYLQLDSPKSMTIRWRTNVATNSRVRYSTSSSSQSNIKDSSTSTTEHSITITGLLTARKYYYTVGTTTEILSSVYYFYSPPDNGHPFPMHFWVLGDSGASTSVAARVRDAYNSKIGSTYTNLMLLLGGDAYSSGTDSEFQSKLFNVFGSQLRQTPVLSALGEQDAGGSTSPSSSLPFFNIFNMPNPLGMGGYGSGTERYYSFNFGIVHFVVLDSWASDRSSSGTMLTWLKNDLSRNKRPWIIALWHHAPYSKGNFDADVVTQMIQMRQNANKILEDYGVDLVLGAHSNTYERSFFIDGFYGTAGTFNSSYLVNGGDGRSSGNGEYTKAAGTKHSGTVYVVEGSSSSTGTGPLNHPAMYISKSIAGSVSIYQNCTKLDVRYFREDVKTGDYFSIRKNNVKPTVSITSPSGGTTFAKGSNITISAIANDPDGTLRRVRFQRNGTAIATDFGSPYSVTWQNVPAGTWTLTAIAEDDLCGSTTSAGVTITVK